MSKEILLIRLSSIGDVLHCTPVAAALKTAWPDCKVTWLVGEVCAELLQTNPDVDYAIVWSRERFEQHLRSGEFSKAYALWQTLKAQLSTKVYDAVLDIQGLFITGMIARLTQTKRRLGLRDARELNPLFMSETANALGSHITERYLGVLPLLGIAPSTRKMTLVVPAAAREFARCYLAQAKIAAQDKLVVLIPGTTWPTKNWPPELFADVAGKLGRDFRIMLCGSKRELAMGQEIISKAGVPVIDAIGQTSLLQMAALLEQAAVVVAGDTGPLYMAAALDIPTVTIFGPTNPVTYTPFGRQHAYAVSKQECSFCHKTKCRLGSPVCMNSIQPAAVVKQVYQVLGIAQ